MIDQFEEIYAVENHLIGGWSLSTKNQPITEPKDEIAGFVTEEDAKYMARLHNAQRLRRRHVMWINAMSIINPSDEIKLGLGEDIIKALQDSRGREKHEDLEPLFMIEPRIVAS